MANTLTNLIPVLYAALDSVSREMVGFIPAVSHNAAPTQAAKDQTITIPIAPAAAAVAISPGLYAPDAGDQTIEATSITISKAYQVPVRWNGEEQRGANSGGYYQQLLQNQFAQAMRTLVNMVEVDLGALYAGASRAYGAAGTAPFASAGVLTDVAQMQKILDDNGAPQSDRSLIINTAAANLGGVQTSLFKVSEAGTSDLLRRGIIGELEGFLVGKSRGVAAHTAGAGTGLTINNGTLAVGTTTLTFDGVTVNSTGYKAGDVIWFNDVTDDKYVVATTTTSTTGSLVLTKPGLRSALVNDYHADKAASYAANLAFSRDAIHLITRLPAMPSGGDCADDVLVITDPVSQLSFQVAVYRQYRQVKYEIGLAWGCALTKPEHTAILLG